MKKRNERNQPREPLPHSDGSTCDPGNGRLISAIRIGRAQMHLDPKFR